MWILESRVRPGMVTHRNIFKYLETVFEPRGAPDCLERHILLDYVQNLIFQIAVVSGPSHERKLGVCSPLFLMTKKTGDLRPVMDLQVAGQSAGEQPLSDQQLVCLGAEVDTVSD